jgi:NADH-quinone oxidoreductase subunit H
VIYVDVVETLYALFSVLISPGLLFLTALAFFTDYFVRKISARYQRRMGPSYVGPFGILQPLYDFIKLIRVKEVVVPRYGMFRVAEVCLLLGIGFIVSSIVFLPLSPFSVVSEFDVLIFFYLSSVMPILMLVLASLSMPGPYTNLGVSRLLSILTIAEPAYFASIVVPVYLASRHSQPFMSITGAYRGVHILYRDPLTIVVLILVVIAFIVSVQVKAMYPPFNIPEAEQEIIVGFLTEFSGPILALAKLLHYLDLNIALLAGVYVIFGGPAPFNHFSPGGAIMLIVKYVVLLFLVVTVKNIMGRYRVDQALVSIFKYSLIPAVLAALISTFIT